MKNQKNELKRKLIKLTEEAACLGPMMRGSVTLMGKKNKQPYFSVGVSGKTRVMYLGNKRAEITRGYIENYKRMLEIVDEMTMINMELLKLMTTDGKGD